MGESTLTELPADVPQKLACDLLLCRPPTLAGLVANCELQAGDQAGSIARDSLVWWAARFGVPLRSRAKAAGFDCQWLDEQQWRRLYPKCWLCGCLPQEKWPHRETVERQHIIRRSHVFSEAREWPENRFAACTPCHAGPLATMPHARQLAWKWLAGDRCGWDTVEEFLAVFCLIDDPQQQAPQRLTAHEMRREYMLLSSKP